jgi:prevent-host-death family protein
MASVTVAQAKNQFSDLLRRAEYAGERVVVHRRGKPVAAIVSTQDLERLQALEDTEDVRDAAEALREAEERGTIPLDVVLRKHGLEHLLIETGTRPARSKRASSARRRRLTRKLATTEPGKSRRR